MPEGERRQNYQKCGGGGVQENVERVRADAIVLGKEGVSGAEHLLIACGACGFGVEEIRNPPGAQLAEK